jgi:hypothetical protein
MTGPATAAWLSSQARHGWINRTPERRQRLHDLERTIRGALPRQAARS